MRTFFQIAEVWQLTNEQQRALLGWPPSSTFFKYKADHVATLPFDMLMRISLVLGIYKDLHILYPEEGLADRCFRDHKGRRIDPDKGAHRPLDHRPGR